MVGLLARKINCGCGDYALENKGSQEKAKKVENNS
jgi:hypothetical protein